eukprot:jgi/Chlat1/8758/Chrsp9S08575
MADKGKEVVVDPDDAEEEGHAEGQLEVETAAIHLDNDEDPEEEELDAAEPATGGAASEQEGVWVRPARDCPHVRDLPRDNVLPPLPRSFDEQCLTCGAVGENWLCLHCGALYCGRYVKGHMLQHFKNQTHPLVFGLRDLSIWCFECSEYLDVYAIRELHPAYAAMHELRFGERPPLPQ